MLKTNETYRQGSQSSLLSQQGRRDQLTVFGFRYVPGKLELLRGFLTGFEPTTWVCSRPYFLFAETSITAPALTLSQTSRAKKPASYSDAMPFRHTAHAHFRKIVHE